MKIIATYPTWRKATPETYIVDTEEADYWAEKLIASGALFVTTKED